MSERFDYVVIGSGSSGSVIASRLSEDPNTSVLVLEAGGSDQEYFYRRPGALALVYQVPQLKKRVDWGYRTTPQKGMNNREMLYTRGKIVGGCSTVNGMLYVRGHRDDYDRWANEHGCTGWAWDDLLPLFKRSEGHEEGSNDAHGGSGPLRVTRQTHVSPVSHAWVEAASKAFETPMVDDFNSGNSEGLGVYQQTCHNRRRSSSSRAFLHEAVDQRDNLQLRIRCHVTKLLMDGTRVTGVAYEENGEPRTVEAGEVILSAGAVNSPQVLLLSGIGPADHLRSVGIDVNHDLPGVGGNLHDHLYVTMRFEAQNTGHRSHAPHFLAGMFRDYFFDKGWFGDTLLEAGGFTKSDPDQPRPDLQWLTVPWSYPEPNNDYDDKQTISKNESFTVLPILLYPKSRGTLRLRSASPFDSPLIDPAFLEHPDDVATIVKGVRLAREVAKTDPLRQHLKAEAFPGPQAQSDEAIAAHCRLAGHTVYHPVGTCKMGVDDQSVVDPASLKVYGLEGLRVADASIMPVLPGGNTNAPSICVGEKASDLIRG